MKKFLLFFVFLFSINTFAQDVYKLKPYAIYASNNLNNDDAFDNWKRIYDTRFLIILNYSESFLTVYGKEKIRYDLLETVEDSKDLEGNLFTIYKALDPKGNEIAVCIKVINTDIIVYIAYEDMAIRYETKVIS